jgi:acetyl esterase
MSAAPGKLTARQRAEYRMARGFAALPPALQVRLSGKPPVEIDGDTLAPDLQLSLALLERRGQAEIETTSPAETRRLRREAAVVYAGRPEPIGAVREVRIEADVPLRARHYAPNETGGPHPLLVYYHGGGFVFGDLDTHDGLCRLLCRHAGAHVLAVDYRLAPEDPFPAAVEDARAALHWTVENAETLGADPGRIGVGGDSAGGNLAAVVSQLAARDGGPAPSLQLLIYPVTDFTSRRRSRELFGEGFFLTSSSMDWFEGHYLGLASEHAGDPRASPLLADDLSGLAPALIVTASFDPLRDEGEAYAQALRAAGTPVALRRFPGFIHGFVNMGGISRGCRDGVVEIAGATRAMFAGVPFAAPAADSAAGPALRA